MLDKVTQPAEENEMPPIGVVHTSTMTFLDATGEKTTTEFFHEPITLLTLENFLDELSNLEQTTVALVIGTQHAESWTGDRRIISNTLPVNKFAQRESALEVTYRDAVTQKEHKLTIGTININLLNFVAGAGDQVIFAGAGASDEILDWVAAFEAYARSPDNAANAVQVVSMRFIGRNS